MNGVITINNPKYPKLLKEINDSPKQLYYRGNWDENIFNNCLAVVGSRRMTSYGKQIANKLVSEIAGAGLTIVSGFMYGIDATAHQSCLNVGARTIAVMPCGIERIHPEYQTKLYADILENNGLVVSEFEGDFMPAFWTYPKRNRIIAGLSKATIVIEAGLKSGSLVTANLAKRYKRKVFAVPGPLTSIFSQGTSQLIKQGADIVVSAQDILEYYGKSIKNIKEQEDFLESFNLNELEKNIIEKLQQESIEIDEISRLLEISVAEIGTTLSLLQLKGLIFIENGKYYIK